MENNQQPSQPQEQATEAVTKAKKSLPKWPLVIILVLISAAILILISGAYFLNNNSQKSGAGTQTPAAKATIVPSPSSNEITNWKTYTNAKYGYSIDYPANWFVREFSDQKSGAAFSKSSKPNDYASESIIIDANRKITDNENQTFEDYVKKAATNEIQNYKSLASIKKVTNTNSAIGFVTTWMIQSIGPGGTAESLPIAYFEIPGNNNFTVKISLDKEEDLAVYEKMLSTVKITQAKQSMLEVPQLGIKFQLSSDISDAYVVPTNKSKDFVYLKVHSLDNEPQCSKDESSTAALSKVGKDEINVMADKKYSESFTGATVGNYFYFIDLAQYSCAESAEGKSNLEKVRTAFKNASATIKSL